MSWTSSSSSSGWAATSSRPNPELIAQVEAGLAKLDPANKEDKKKITSLTKDKAALTARLPGPTRS